MQTEWQTARLFTQTCLSKKLGYITVFIFFGFKIFAVSNGRFFQGSSSLYGPGHPKMCLMAYANNKGADQPAHPYTCILALSKVSRY